MGGIVSTGEDNDDLIDKLKTEGYIETDVVEDVFRAIDRAHYYMPEHRDNAYRDSAWKHGHLHLSAPCIYTKVMENLKLERSLTFLNLGSGTGYLSSMAGLILGHYGVNHGIEIHEDVVHYAKERLSEFHEKCQGFDSFEFCEPQFVVGNCLLLACGSRLYDRVYCGTACPPEHENFMKNLIKVGGILVMPINDQLLQITRLSETEWSAKSVLPVSFATLVAPSSNTSFEHVDLPPIIITTLQDACRAKIRQMLSASIKQAHPELKKRRPPKPKVKNEAVRLGDNRISIFPMSMSMLLMGHFDEMGGEEQSDEEGGDAEDEEEDEEDEEPDEMSDSQATDMPRNDHPKQVFNSFFTDDIDCEDGEIFFSDARVKNDTEDTCVNDREDNMSGLVSVSDIECSDTADDDDDDEIAEMDDDADFNSRRVLNITNLGTGLRVPRKSHGSYSTSADTETSGIGTLSDHSDDQLSSSFGRSPESHHASSPGMSSRSRSWNLDMDESCPRDCGETSGGMDQSGDYSRSLDSGRDELMSDVSLRCNSISKKMRTQSENDSQQERGSEEVSGKKQESVKPDVFKDYMIEKVEQLPIPIALKSYLMFYRL